MASQRRRLAQDHAILRSSPPADYFFPPNTSSDDLTSLTIYLSGPTQTPFESGVFLIRLRIPPAYPQEPPKASFRTKIFHPNVDERTGDVCVDTLKRDWKPSLTLKDVLVTIRCLLVYPNPTSSLNEAAGKLLLDDYDGYARHAVLMTSVHAGVSSELKPLVAEAKRRGEDNPKAPVQLRRKKQPGKLPSSSAAVAVAREKAASDSEGGDSGKENAETHVRSERPVSPLGKRRIEEPPRDGTAEDGDLEQVESGRKSPKLKEGQSANSRALPPPPPPPPASASAPAPVKKDGKKSKGSKTPAKKVGLKRF